MHLMLTLPFTRRQLRHTACVTLFAWMFALLSGVVNACLIQPNPPGELGSVSSHAGPVAGAVAGPATPQVQHVQHHGADEGDGLGNHSAKAGCLKFCADESSAVIKSKAAQADVPGPIFMASVPSPSTARVVVASQWLPVERPASVGPPLFIRLLRMTI